jgi:hypothetical protein
MKFNKATLPLIRRQIEGALSDELAQYEGMEFQLGNITFTNEGDKFWCKLVVTTPEAKVNDREELKTICARYDLPLIKNGYEIIDFKPKSYKYPFVFKTPTGEKRKASVSYLKSVMGTLPSVSERLIQVPMPGSLGGK